ncbi:Demethylrebeccamycin-D-glucose O-methyltransferase [Gemmata sp. SH-PL17]|uniref:class I SAM-dependent methyltransferase n=1 Tax=Gemmata sp. SH-PL17 TaxID=1630693 RepID=UPI00078BF023|nr:class I SAM-dependent methyltransferase [Gemmata sp. SH-PL17]AMV28450.1 Demethylrebeccamycin-D-glucose O-methyltransferase [Gemmata sp. SH-PL17]
MHGTERRLSEQLFHDRQAAERAEAFRAGRADLRFDTGSYLDHETWVRPAFEALGPLRGKHALDYGCGHGMAAVAMARAGAIVTAFDLSPGYVNEARARAAANDVRIECVAADGEDLPFPAASFDAVWGNAILHHLDLAKAGTELRRVLKPGGIAVFCEPWGGNPLLGFARGSLPYPGKDRTPDEHPLTHRDLQPLRDIFPSVEVRGFQLLGMVRRVWRNRHALGLLDTADTHLLRALPALGNWCRYAVIVLRNAQ